MKVSCDQVVELSRSTSYFHSFFSIHPDQAGALIHSQSNSVKCPTDKEWSVGNAFFIIQLPAMTSGGFRR